MTLTRQPWQKQSGARGAAIEIYFMRPLEPASARGLFLTGVSTMGGPARLRKAATSESTATDQRVTVGSAAALKPWQQDRPSGGVPVRNSLNIRILCCASWPAKMQIPRAARS